MQTNKHVLLFYFAAGSFRSIPFHIWSYVYQVDTIIVICILFSTKIAQLNGKVAETRRREKEHTYTQDFIAFGVIDISVRSGRAETEAQQ